MNPQFSSHPFYPTHVVNIAIVTAFRGSAATYGYGVIPGSGAENDGPLHVVVLLDRPVFAGAFLTSRVIGMLGRQCLVTVCERAEVPFRCLEELTPAALLEMEDLLCEKGCYVCHPRRGAEEAGDWLALRRYEPAGDRLAAPLFASFS